MKFRAFIWISATALLLLLPVQFYFISETFRTKQQQFDSQFGSLSKLGLFEFESKYYDHQQDSVLALLDDLSYEAVNDLEYILEGQQKDSVREEIRTEFSIQLNKLVNRELFLKSYFKEAGETLDFITRSVIRDVRLLSPAGEVIVYTDSSGTPAEVNHQEILVNSYRIERNYYRLVYDYYISFPDRSGRIRKEMTLTVTLSIATLFIVFAVFFLTLRNLLIQRRHSELKSDFINNITHELKTPLSTIAVASSSLAKNTAALSSERVSELSGIIGKQNRYLTKMIDRILDISIWEKEQVRIEKEATPVKEMVEEILADFKRNNPDVKLDFKLKGVNDSLLVVMDRVHMTTVINNLLSNAFKYGGNPPVITVTLEQTDFLQIRVGDNGKGIKEEDGIHLFEKFFRGGSARRDAIRGLGLGLYYANQIVMAHEGKISYESETGKGTVFTIEIPL